MKLITSISSFLTRHGLKKVRVQRKLIEPTREWMTCLFLAFLLGAVLSGYAGYDFYTQYTHVDAGEGNVDEEQFRFKTKQAEGIAERFRAREAAYHTLEEGLTNAASVSPATSTPGTKSDKASTSTPLAGEETEG